MATSTARVGAPRVLCVEDDEASRTIAAAALREFDLSFAPSGHDAVLTYSAEAFDAFVLDVRLPDHNGRSLCRDIRRIDPHVPIVIWTVLDADDIREWVSATRSVYLRKTDNYEELRRVLTTLMAAAEERFADAAREATAALSTHRDDADRAQDAFLGAGGTLRQFERWRRKQPHLMRSRSRPR